MKAGINRRNKVIQHNDNNIERIYRKSQIVVYVIHNSNNTMCPSSKIIRTEWINYEKEGG
jgi:hypothetical protein